MKKYIKPIVKLQIIVTSNLLSGSFKMDISDDPATEPAASKEMQFFDDELWEEKTF